MKKYLGIFALGAVLALEGCGDHDRMPAENSTAPMPQPGMPTTNAAPPDSGMMQPPAQNQPPPAPTPPTPTTSPAMANYPMGIVIPGKKGYVKSPYAQYGQDIDVRGFAPGTAVRDPISQKIFIVPPQ